jgi:hypothetical protein
MGVDVGPALACLADGWGVYQGSELGDVLGQQPVKQVDVGGAQMAEVAVFLQIRVLSLEGLQAWTSAFNRGDGSDRTSLSLQMGWLDIRRGQSVGAQVFADLDGI